MTQRVRWVVGLMSVAASGLLTAQSPRDNRPCIEPPAPNVATLELELEPDSFTLGGNRPDAPERIRGLHVRGDSAGSPIVVAISPSERRSFYLWALDTRLDGVERYDRLAVSLSDSVAIEPERLIELAADRWERIPVNPRGSADIQLRAPVLGQSLRGLRVCVASTGKSPTR